MLTLEGKEIPETLDELLRPRSTAHIVIDLQNDCCHPNGTAARAGADMSAYPSTISTVKRLVQATRAMGVLQVFVKVLTLPDGMSDSPSWIRLRHRLARTYAGTELPKTQAVSFCLQGSWGAELVDELKALVTPRDVVVEKHRSSAFFGTNLDMILRSNAITTLLFTGCTTEGCVESTVRDAGFLDYFPVVVADGVNSDVAELHDASLRVMRAYRADVVTANEAVEALAAATPVSAAARLVARSHARVQA